MNIELMLKLAKKQAGMIVLASLLAAALSFAALVISQKNFRANTDILVVQNQNGFSDYYALSKSADFLSGVLIESIYSEKFLDEMMATGIITKDFLPENKRDRLEEWNKRVKISKNSNTGILNIEVYGNEQNQVSEVSSAILEVLTTKSFLFLGKGQDIDIRVLSGPIFERNPSIIGIMLAVIGGFLVGMILMLMGIYYQAQFGKYKNILPISAAEKILTPEEETERRAQEYWNSRYSNQ